MPPGVRGTIELTVRRPNGDLKRYVLSEAGETLAVEERSAPEADAKITGSERAWVEALSPDTDRSELEIQGDQRLATALLDGLSVAAARDAQVA
jgi:hypothetical protein